MTSTVGQEPTSERARKLCEKLSNKLALVHPTNVRHDLPLICKLTYGELSDLRALALAAQTTGADVAGLREAREPADLRQTLIGRAQFLRDRGEVKTPDLLERAAAALANGSRP